MIIVHVVEPFATGINTLIQELVFGMPKDKHIVIHGERKDTRNIEAIKKEYRGKATFIKWKHAQRDINFKKDFKAFLQLRKELRKTKFDVLHLHSSKAGVIGRLVGWLDNYKNIIYTPNGASFLRKDISKRRVGQYQMIEKFFSRLNGKVISSSESEYKAYSDIDVKSKIIENGVQVEIVERDRKDPNVFNIVTCGKITTQKDPAFLKKIASFFKDDESVQFNWIGDGELKQELKHVSVTGWCSKREVYYYLSQADLYISTSLWEGLPLAGIEAMAFGLPLLMHDCVGNNDLVNSGINGFLFDSKVKAIEAIEFLKDNKNQLQLLSENSKKMYDRHYNNFRCAKEYHMLYRIVHRKSKMNISVE